MMVKSTRHGTWIFALCLVAIISIVLTGCDAPEEKKEAGKAAPPPTIKDELEGKNIAESVEILMGKYDLQMDKLNKLNLWLPIS